MSFQRYYNTREIVCQNIYASICALGYNVVITNMLNYIKTKHLILKEQYLLSTDFSDTVISSGEFAKMCKLVCRISDS